MPKLHRLTRDESRAQTRERLLEAARRAFAQGGYGGASVETIAAEAGYSKGAFYSNFDSKETIFLELLARHMEAEATQLGSFVAPGRAVGDILDSLEPWLDKMNEDTDWAMLAMELQLHACRSESFARAYDALHATHRERLGGLIAQLFALSGKALPAASVDLASALMALAQGLVLQRSRYTEGCEPAGPMIKTVLRSLITAADPEAAGPTSPDLPLET